MHSGCRIVTLPTAAATLVDCLIIAPQNRLFWPYFIICIIWIRQSASFNVSLLGPGPLDFWLFLSVIYRQSFVGLGINSLIYGQFGCFLLARNYYWCSCSDLIFLPIKKSVFNCPFRLLKSVALRMPPTKVKFIFDRIVVSILSLERK